MRKLFLLAILCLLPCSFAYAQKLLSVEETTDGIGVYPCQDRHEAMVVFVCRENFDLVFESNYDQELAMQVDSTAGAKYYHIVFVTQAPGVSYEGRRLTIKAPGFKDFIMPLNLRDKQKFEYTVSDPYSVLRSPFFLYQEKANELFYSGNYQGAKDNYQMVKACPEYQNNKEEVDGHIALCDSMIEWGALATEHERFAQFNKAYTYYLKMLRINSSNDDIRDRLSNCAQKQLTDCEAEMTLADHYVRQNEYEKAESSYQRIIDKECSQAVLAAREMANVRSLIRRKKARARCFMYDYAPNMPIGFTYATCHYEGHGGYFSLHFNKEMIDIMSNKSFCKGTYDRATDEEFHYEDGFFDNFGGEAMMSFGWTLQIWNPIFVHFGVGYHGAGYYTFDQSNFNVDISTASDSHIYEDMETKYKNKYSELNWYNAITPEAGLILKYWRVCAKATYQYHYWFSESEDALQKDLFETSYVTFGLGFCW